MMPGAVNFYFDGMLDLRFYNTAGFLYLPKKMKTESNLSD